MLTVESRTLVIKPPGFDNKVYVYVKAYTYVRTIIGDVSEPSGCDIEVFSSDTHQSLLCKTYEEGLTLSQGVAHIERAINEGELPWLILQTDR